ncbi:hypothetical protein UPYG_G00155680 [Umbra pygmaea]|uniref:Uncharacterized protein n=1 Tax=Umbra pygmaea TaxID=75934 RepID=A0ABD0X2J5_UMBPY
MTLLQLYISSGLGYGEREREPSVVAELRLQATEVLVIKAHLTGTRAAGGFGGVRSNYLLSLHLRQNHRLHFSVYIQKDRLQPGSMFE